MRCNRFVLQQRVDPNTPGIRASILETHTQYATLQHETLQLTTCPCHFEMKAQKAKMKGNEGKSPKSKKMKANELCSASKNVALRVHSEKKWGFPPRLRPKTPLSARIISILRLWKAPISSQRVGKSNILHIRKWRKCGGSDFFFQKGACRNAGGTLPMSKYSHHVGKNGKIDDQSDIFTHLTGLVWYIIYHPDGKHKEIN